MEIYNLLIRYTKDLDGKDITLEDLYKLPWWRCVWGNWLAKAYYGVDNYYQKIEDVPEGSESYQIIDGDVMTQYFMSRGTWVVQPISKEDCKSIYGSVI